ncbi:MAG: DinB family protein [Chloroflexi bacterium]|nr:DinB family protein [Chloroflexota bacterium]
MAAVATRPEQRVPGGTWLDDLESAAPNAVAAFRGIEAGRFISVRREVRRRGGEGSTQASLAELDALAAELVRIVERLTEAALRAPGGEEDWNVAQTIGHDATARSGLVLAASLAASGRWPAAAPTVVPGVPGPADASRDELLRRLEGSRRVIARAGRSVAGHETDPCPLEHPLVGRLRCGEWLLFAGVHDLMHLEQLHGLEARFQPG